MVQYKSLTILSVEAEHMAGVTVASDAKPANKDIMDFLEAVGKYFDYDIYVTSGQRTSQEQADTMWQHWGKLRKKESNYKNDHKKLEELYVKACEDKKATNADKKKAKEDFYAIALKVKSKHIPGRAVDIRRTSLPSSAYRGLCTRMKDVPEGRDDIYHFESDQKIPEVTDEDKKSWGPSGTQDQKQKPGSETGMDKGAMKLVLAKAKRAPINCAAGLSKDGRFGLLLMHISRKPKALAAELVKAIPDARNMRWGTAAVDAESDPKLVMFQLNKPLAGLDRKLRKTVKVAGYTNVEIADRSTGEE